MTHVSSSCCCHNLLLVTGYLFTSVTLTILEMIGIASNGHILRINDYYRPTSTDDWSSLWITTKYTFLNRILKVCLTKVKSWIKVNHKRTQISFFFHLLWWMMILNIYEVIYIFTDHNTKTLRKHGCSCLLKTKYVLTFFTFIQEYWDFINYHQHKVWHFLKGENQRSKIPRNCSI